MSKADEKKMEQLNKGEVEDIPTGSKVKMSLTTGNSVEATWGGITKGDNEVLYDAKSTPDKETCDIHFDESIVEEIEVQALPAS